MSEYNYTYTSNNTENGGFGTDGGNTPKKPKKHTGMKITAFLMSMALVSGGSVMAYRHFAGENLSPSKATAEESEPLNASNGSDSSLEAKTISIIEPTESEGRALTNEEIVKKALPSVVGIESSFTTDKQISSNFGDFSDFGFGFGDFGFGNGYSFGNGSGTQEYKGTGTGVIVSENGYIVTNAHVIFDSEYGAGEADSVSVLLDGNKTYDAEIIGYDTDFDLAVIKIDETGLTAAEFGDSDSLQLGESVLAIGNPLGFDLMNTVTGGMISGLNRNITINDKAMNLIQTDAAINSGNSGGPLINKYGQVIGINSSKMSSSYGSSEASIEGIGFAIPSNAAASIVDDIMKYGHVTGKPQLGISCQDVTESAAEMYNMPVGVFVKSVNKGSAAEKAGIQEGDIIVEADGTTVKTAAELTAQKNKFSAGDTMEIVLIRDGEEKTVKVTLDERVEEEDKKDSEEQADKPNGQKMPEIEEVPDFGGKNSEEDTDKSSKKNRRDKAELPDFLEKAEESAEENSAD